MWNKKAFIGFVFLFLGLGAFALFSSSANATGGINPIISFEGKIVNNNGTNIADGTYNMEFKVYSGASNIGTGDTLLFTEDWLVGSTQGGITLTSGTYEVNLGSAGAGDSVALSSLNWNQYPLWLSLQIGNTSSCTIISNFQTNCGGDTEMKPYIQFTSTPYSFTANQIGYTNSGFVGTLSFASTLSATDNVTIPDASGTICLQNASACGFAASSGSTNYIQNQNSAVQTTAVFRISGTGQASAFDASSASTLTLGTTTATNVTIGQAVSTSTVTVNDALTVTGDQPAAGNATSVLNVTGGTGAATATAGNGATIVLQSGNGGNGSTANGSGGNITLSAGSAGSGAGSAGIAGSVIVKNQANSTTAFQIQNSSGQDLLQLDTSGGNQNNLITNASIESSITGNWAAKGTGAAAQDSSKFLYGANSLKINSVAANDGAKQTLNATLTANTQYNVLFYVLANANTTPSVRAVYSVDGAAESVICSLTRVANSNDWQRYSCTFTTPASGITSSNAIFIEITNTNSQVWVDGVLVQLSSLADSNYREGKLIVQATVTSPLILENATNSSTAFSVQNSSGGQIFNIDSGTTNLIGNPSFEVNTVGWSVKGSAKVSRDTSQAKYGIASMLVTTTGSASDGTAYTLPASLAVGATNYTLSWSAINTGTAFTSTPPFTAGYTNTGGDTACNVASVTPTTTLSNTAWNRYSCQFTVSTTAATAVWIKQNEAVAHTFNIDGVQLVIGTNAISYGLGQISISAPIITPLQLRNQTDASNALQVQNAAGTPMFTVDNANLVIQIGNTVASGTATVLALSTKNTSADPTCVLGAIYYSSVSASQNEFRACRGTSPTDATPKWYNLIAGVDIQDITATGTWTAPTGISMVMVIVCGGGGGGGSGGSTATTSTVRVAGSGGGGGARAEGLFNAADITPSSPVTVTVGGTANGAAAGAAAGGLPGNGSSFGAFIKAWGGGAGQGGNTAGTATTGGAGGGIGANGGNGSAATTVGGDGVSGQVGTGWAGAGDASNGGGLSAESGGAGAGAAQTSGSFGSQGGNSIWGGSGGGAGGGVTTGNTANGGGNGGGGATNTDGSGLGANGGGANGNAGLGTAATGSSVRCGAGGGGGGGNSTAAGGSGGNGGIPGGGGGGGGGGTVATGGGAGGNGARGEVWVFSW